jgi:legumain
VLVAGSKTYGNYRHQSDVAHAYQIMLKNGIPADQIIHMSYDDVAHNWRNPFKGQLFNQPDGDNVYDQSNIDYSKRDVTAEKFLAVLTGDAETAGGKVL